MELSRRAGGGRGSSLTVEIARYADVFGGHLREDGLRSTLGRTLRFFHERIRRPKVVARRKGRTFSVGTAVLPYELGRYNGAWLNERTVEIALAHHLLSGVDPETVLEVGNVLAHYGHTGHSVVDKYEAIEGVINDDVLDFHPGRTYDAVLAISTLEHVGFDEPTKIEHAATSALAAMRALVSPSGFLLVTVPLGYNPGLDSDIATGAFSCQRQFSLRRVSADNEWTADTVEAALGSTYGSPYNNANAVYVGIDGPGASSVRL